jgi:hypothetical protein
MLIEADMINFHVRFRDELTGTGQFEARNFLQFVLTCPPWMLFITSEHSLSLAYC